MSRPNGRPTRYRKEYCEEVVAHMEQGFSFESFAGRIGVCKQTIYGWKDRHAEFLDAVKRGTEKSRFFWERLGIAGTLGQMQTMGPNGLPMTVSMKDFRPVMWIFNMKNRFASEWKDKHEIYAEIPSLSVEKTVLPYKKSFEEFCAAADYPNPYPKQVEMMVFGMNETEPRLLLGSRGYGKTDYVVILGAAYKIYCNPRSFRALLVTKSSERNKAILKEISTACRKNGCEFEMENSESIREVGLQGKDHTVSAVTIGSTAIRGRHPDMVIMDDPVTEEDSSEATRHRVQAVYNEVSKLCPNVLIIGQPVHKYDLYETLRPLLMKMEVPHGSIPELDHDLQAQLAAGVSAESISASYHLKVVSESGSPFERIRSIDAFPPGGSAIAFIDPSFEGGDYTALTILKAHFDGVAVEGYLYKKAWNHCLDEMAERMAARGVKRLAFETNSLGDQPIIMLRSHAKLSGVGVVGKKSTTFKHSRIMNAGAFAHLIFLAKTSDRLYIEHVVKYEYGAKFDDAPDSLASCLEWAGLIRGKKV